MIAKMMGAGAVQFFFVSLVGLGLVSCGSSTSDTKVLPTQTVIRGIAGAQCMLENDQGEYVAIAGTPGIVIVPSDSGPLQLRCDSIGFKPEIGRIENKEGEEYPNHLILKVIPDSKNLASSSSRRRSAIADLHNEYDANESVLVTALKRDRQNKKPVQKLPEQEYITPTRKKKINSSDAHQSEKGIELENIMAHIPILTSLRDKIKLFDQNKTYQNGNLKKKETIEELLKNVTLTATDTQNKISALSNPTPFSLEKSSKERLKEFEVQVGGYRQRVYIDKATTLIRKIGFVPSKYDLASRRLTRIRFGPFETRKEAAAAADLYLQAGGDEAMVVMR